MSLSPLTDYSLNAELGKRQAAGMRLPAKKRFYVAGAVIYVQFLLMHFYFSRARQIVFSRTLYAARDMNFRAVTRAFASAQ